jgi:hypothetical protein
MFNVRSRVSPRFLPAGFFARVLPLSIPFLSTCFLFAFYLISVRFLLAFSPLSTYRLPAFYPFSVRFPFASTCFLPAVYLLSSCFLLAFYTLSTRFLPALCPLSARFLLAFCPLSTRFLPAFCLHLWIIVYDYRTICNRPIDIERNRCDSVAKSIRNNSSCDVKTIVSWSLYDVLNPI